jgi:hypothetical protein
MIDKYSTHVLPIRTYAAAKTCSPQSLCRLGSWIRTLGHTLPLILQGSGPIEEHSA